MSTSEYDLGRCRGVPGECLPREAMRTLKSCMVGSWKNPPNSYLTMLELGLNSLQDEGKSNGSFPELRSPIHGI